jgi:hypothetical protein
MYEIIGIAKIGQDPANTLRRAIIADHAGKHAGELVLDTDVVSLPTDTAEFILICEVKSTKRHIWMDGHGGRSQDVVIHDSMGPSAKRRKVLPKEEKDWSYYKVMLIIRVRDYAYRVADRYKRSVPLPIPITSLFCSRSIPKTWVYAQRGNDRRPTLIEMHKHPLWADPRTGAYAKRELFNPS